MGIWIKPLHRFRCEKIFEKYFESLLFVSFLFEIRNTRNISQHFSCIKNVDLIFSLRYFLGVFLSQSNASLSGPIGNSRY